MSVGASTDELQSKVNARVSEWRETLGEGLPPKALAALALVPAWTEQLADQAKFPVSNLLQFLAEAEKRGLCLRGPIAEPGSSTVRSARLLMLLWRFLDTQQRVLWLDQVLERVKSVPYALERLQFLIALSAPGNTIESEIQPALGEQLDAEIQARMSAAWALASRSAVIANRAWESLDKVEDPEERAALQTSLLSCFDGLKPSIEAVRATIRMIRDREARARALLALATLTTADEREQLMDEALGHVFAMEDQEERILALCALAPQFDDARRPQALQAALGAAGQIASISARARVLFHLSRLDESQEQTALIRDTINELLRQETSEQRDGSLAFLVAALARTDFNGANMVRETIREPSARLEALVALMRIPDRSTSLSDKAIAIAKEADDLIDRTGRYELCGDFVLYLTPGLYSVSKLVRKIEERLPEGRRRREALLNLASRLPRDDGRSIFKGLVQSSRTLSDERDVLEAFAQIAPHLTGELLDEACKAVLDLPLDRRFAMPDSMRPVVIDYLSRPKELGVDGLQRILSQIGKQINDAAKDKSLDVAPATVRWARLAALLKKPAGGCQFLMDEVGRLVGAGDLGAAIEWYTTAERIAPIMGVELRQAILLARRDVEVESRRIMDARHLERYLDRADQGRAFQQLLDDPARWALHYLGTGGVGKTMLLRYIMARLAVRDGTALPVARIDFDDMSPEFPVRQPGTLLLGLADDLRRRLPPGEGDRFTKFRDDVLEFHGALSREDSPGDPLTNIHTPEFERVLDKFVAMTSSLTKPVVLILDTCEELAKAEPAGASIPAVEATFEILERLHARESGIRVVFAGRRLLTRGGDSLPDGRLAWNVRGNSLSERTSILPKAKDYLRLHLIRGFTEAEADQYFFRALREPLDAPRRAAILKRSPDLALASDIEFDPQTSSAPEPCYNPFDISLYADWVLADKTVTAETLASGERDPYVEMRIVSHIGKELLPAIPGVVLLRRFDQAMVQPMLDTDPDTSARLFRDLGGQEWIDLRDGFLQVNANLADRLHDYYRKHEPLQLERASACLAPALNELVQSHLCGDAPFDKRTKPLLDGALRILLPADAALLWDRFERRLTEVRNWAAAQGVCEFLLGEGNAVGADTSSLRSAVRATLIAARTHTSRDYIPTDWGLVLKAVASHPVPRIRAWLEARARMGERRPEKEGREALEGIGALMPSLDEWQADQLRGAICAAIDEKMDNASGFAESAATLIDEKSPELHAYVRAVVSHEVEWDQLPLGRITSQRWLDWRAPASIRDRARLLSLPHLLKEHEALELRCREVFREVDTVDSDRLASALLMALLDQRAVPPELIEPVTGELAYDDKRIPLAAVHHATLPLFTSVAEVMIGCGHGEDALALAESVRQRAQSKQDAPAAKAAEVIRLKVTRRYRLVDAMSALHDLVPVQHPNASQFHYDFAVRYAGSAKDARVFVDAVPFLHATSDSGHGAANDPHSVLDFVEAEQIAKRISLDPSPLGLVAEKPPSEADDLRVALRWAALRGGAAERFRPQEPPRRLAEAMLEEGELVVLRLPDRALWLFSGAYEAYMRSSDSIGAMLAALCATIAALKADVAAEARQWFDRAETHYGELIAGRSVDLPSWQDLSTASIQGMRSSVWYPWLLRIGLLNARLCEGTAGGPLTRDMQQLIERFLAGDGHPDFALTPFERETRAEKPQPATIAGTLLRVIQTAIVAGSLALYFAFMYALPDWAKYNKLLYDLMKAFSVAIIAVVAGGFLARWLARRLVKDAAVRLDISAEPGAPNVSMTLIQRFRGLSRFAFVFLDDVHQGEVETDLDLSVLVAREPDGHGDLARMRRDLDRLRPGVFTRPIVPLYASESVAPYCWEMLLGSTPTRPGTPLDERISFVRAAAARHVFEYDRPPWNGVVGIVTAEEYAKTFMKPWRRATTIVPPVDRGVGRVLHVIGRPKRTRSGPTFIVPTHRSATAPFNLREWNAESADLLIVQEEPVERIHRLDVDRQQTREARAWAMEAFGSGVRSLVLIPAMPIAISIPAIETIGRKLRAGVTPTLWTLAAAVTHARRRIARFNVPRVKNDLTNLRGGMDDAAVIGALNELALELTLFVRSEHFSPRNRFAGWM